MNHAQLRAFHAVARAGGFTAAARELHLTQPTLSAQVKALESRYGVRLLDRIGRGVRLTPLGETLFEITRPLEALDRRAHECLRRARGLEGVTLRVGADGPHHAIPLLRDLTRRHPSLGVTLHMGNAERVLADLRQARIDVAVVADPEPDPRLHRVELVSSPLVLIVAAGHPWARRRRVALAELARERLILREAASRTRGVFERALEAAGVRLAAVMQIESREAVREAVAAGLGIGVVARAELDPDRRVRPVPIAGDPLTIAEHAVCFVEHRELQPVAAFLEVAGRAVRGRDPGALSVPGTGARR